MRTPVAAFADASCAVLLGGIVGWVITIVPQMLMGVPQ